VMRLRFIQSCGTWHQIKISGVTSNIPNTSPCHQFKKLCQATDFVTTPLNTNALTPIVALTTEPNAPVADSNKKSCGCWSAGLNRFMCDSIQKQLSASNELPKAITIDKPIGLPCMTLPASAPMKILGQYLSLPSMSAASAKPLDGHTIETTPLVEKYPNATLASSA